MAGLLIRWFLTALGIMLVGHLIEGIEVDGLWPAVIAALLLGITNAVVRPIVIFLTLPITILTLGFFLLVINALMLSLVSSVVEGFRITGFWPAFFGAILMTLFGWVATALISDRGRVELMRQPPERLKSPMDR